MEQAETSVFCNSIDDSNWDASFEMVLNKVLTWHSMNDANSRTADATKWACVRPVVRRIQHVGTCGAHLRQSSNCAANVRVWAPAIAAYASKLEEIEKIEQHSDGKSPPALPVWELRPTTSVAMAAMYGAQPNGGWGDSRDRALCSMLPNMRFAKGKPTENVADQGEHMASPSLLDPDQVLTSLPFVAVSGVGVVGSGAR